MRSRNGIINQRTAYLQMLQMRQAVLLCYLQILRQFLINYQTSGRNSVDSFGMRRTSAYDKMDNIKTRNTQAGNYAYNYDNLYRLNEVKKDTQQTEAYTYDQVGNRTTSKATTGDWTYNSNNELLSLPGVNGQSSSTTYQYDANGNTIQKNDNGNIQNYVYNADNRLIEVKDAAKNTIAKYTYDPFGRRIKKQTGVNGQPIPSPLAGEGQGEGVNTTYYLYSDEGLIGEYDSTGIEIKTYGYKPNSTWSTDPVFCHSNENGNPGFYFYHNDHLGTPQKMTNLSGAIVWSATYDAFGKATVDAVSSITNNLRFPGQYFDAETGWHYNWNRYYDPGTGRYVTEDPIGFGGGINYFSYVANNPLNLKDASGLIWITIGWEANAGYEGVENFSKWLLQYVTKAIGSGLGRNTPLPLWDPDQHIGRERTLIQEWRCDWNNPQRDKEFPRGTRRRITQTWTRNINYPGEFLLNDPRVDYVYDWRPMVPDRTYKNYPDTKYENLQYLRQGGNTPYLKQGN